MMKISNAYFKHPITGEIIKPGEMYQDFNKGAVPMQRTNTAAEVESDKELDKELDKEPDKEPGREPDVDIKPLYERSVTELRKLAKDAKIAGYSTIDKDGLVTALEALTGKSPAPLENGGGNASGVSTDVINNDHSENS